MGCTVKLQFIMLKKFGLRQHCLNIEYKGTRGTEARLNSNYTSCQKWFTLRVKVHKIGSEMCELVE